jgi:hypothetical protein
MAFGGGARMCVGWRFAMQEAVLALVRLFQVGGRGLCVQSMFRRFSQLCCCLAKPMRQIPRLNVPRTLKPPGPQYPKPQAYTFVLSPGQVPLRLRQGLTLSPADGVWVTPVARGAEADTGAAPVVAPVAA